MTCSKQTMPCPKSQTKTIDQCPDYAQCQHWRHLNNFNWVSSDFFIVNFERIPHMDLALLIKLYSSQYYIVDWHSGRGLFWKNWYPHL